MSNFNRLCEGIAGGSERRYIDDIIRKSPMYRFVTELVTSEPFNYELIEQRRAYEFRVGERQLSNKWFKCSASTASGWIHFNYPVIIDIIYDRGTPFSKPLYSTTSNELSFQLKEDPNLIGGQRLNYIEDAKVWWSIINKFDSGRSAQDVSEAYEFALNVLDSIHYDSLAVSRKDLIDSHLAHKRANKLELSDEDWGRML